MRVFVTGSTGFIGSAVVKELLTAGHQVLGLTRSDTGAQALTNAGAQPHHGSIEDLDSLRTGAEKCDAVIHLAFNHDFSKFAANCEADRKVIQTLGSALTGSDRPLLVTSGTGIAKQSPGRPAREDDPPVPSTAVPRAASEEAAHALASQGVNVSIIRLPQVHDPRKQGLITYAIDVARQKKISAYVGDGLNRWAAVHILDAARLYRLALEKRTPGAIYHAVGEEGVPMKKIAETIGQGLRIPVVSLAPQDVPAHFGWLAMFAAHDMPATSAQTRQQLNWNPTGPGLIADLQKMDYSRI
jgi:nucleoside-diphosphate-sugar epimerase